MILLFIGNQQAEVPTEQRSKSRFKMHVLEEIKAVWARCFFAVGGAMVPQEPWRST